MGMLKYFSVVLLISLFYSVSISILGATLPDDMINYISDAEDYAERLGVDDTTNSLLGSVDSQTSVPALEAGALVFYSGNIILDLLLNFMFAIPGIFTLVLQGVGLLAGFNTVLLGWIQTFVAGMITIMYVLGLISMLSSLRSGQVIN